MTYKVGKVVAAAAVVLLCGQLAMADYVAYKAGVEALNPLGYWDANQATLLGGIPDLANARNLTFGSDAATRSIGTGTGPMAGAGTWANFTPYSIYDPQNTTLGVGAYNMTSGSPTPFQLANGFTIEAWIRSDQANIPHDFGGPDWGAVFACRGYTFGIAPTGEVRMAVYGSVTDFASGDQAPDGWVMIDAVFAAGGATAPTFYINGVPDGGSPTASNAAPYSGASGVTAPGDIFGLGHRLRMSNANTLADRAPYQGDISQVAFFVGELSSGQIAQNYANAIPEPATMSLLVLGGIATLIRRRRRA